MEDWISFFQPETKWSIWIVFNLIIPPKRVSKAPEVRIGKAKNYNNNSIPHCLKTTLLNHTPCLSSTFRHGFFFLNKVIIALFIIRQKLSADTNLTLDKPFSLWRMPTLWWLSLPLLPPQQAKPAYFLPTAPGCQVKSVLLLVEIIKTCSLGCLLVWSSRPLQVGELSEFVNYWIRRTIGFYSSWKIIRVSELYYLENYRSWWNIRVRKLSE